MDNSSLVAAALAPPVPLPPAKVVGSTQQATSVHGSKQLRIVHTPVKEVSKNPTPIITATGIFYLTTSTEPGTK